MVPADRFLIEVDGHIEGSTCQSNVCLHRLVDMTETEKVGTFGWLWIVGVFAFSVVRALVAWPTLGRYGVNPWVFLFIDVVTAFPYAYGQVKLIKECVARNLSAIQLWSLVVLVTFMAPYIYIFVAGSGELPLLGYIIVTALIVVFGAASMLRIGRSISAQRADASLLPNEKETTP